jgi:ankyrin repeat protein
MVMVSLRAVYPFGDLVTRLRLILRTERKYVNNADVHGQTVAHYAAQRSDGCADQILECLMQFGADLNSCNMLGLSALDLVSFYNFYCIFV